MDKRVAPEEAQVLGGAPGSDGGTARTVVERRLAADVLVLLAERDADRAALERANLSARFVDRRDRQYGRLLYNDLPEEKRGVIDALERYGGMLCEMRFAPGVPKLRRLAAEMGVDVADFRAVEDNEAAPFDDAITRKACVACGRDPQPMLDTAAKIREMLREPEKT